MENKVSESAIWCGLINPILISGTEEAKYLIDDPLMISLAKTVLSELEERQIVGGEFWEAYRNNPPLEAIRQIEGEWGGKRTGMVHHHGARKLYISRQIRQALENGQARQVVVLGAGFDTLASRLSAGYPACSFFEVDHPNTGAIKAKIMRGNKKVRALLGGAASNIRFLTADLSIPGALEELAPKPQMIVGLKDGLTEQEHKAGPKKEPFVFGIPAAEAKAFFRTNGYETVEAFSAGEIQGRHFTRFADPEKQAAYLNIRDQGGSECIYKIRAATSGREMGNAMGWARTTSLKEATRSD